MPPWLASSIFPTYVDEGFDLCRIINGLDWLLDHISSRRYRDSLFRIISYCMTKSNGDNSMRLHQSSRKLTYRAKIEPALRLDRTERATSRYDLYISKSILSRLRERIRGKY